MWKTPFRPNNDVTQSFNDGIVKIYSVTDIARPGYYPKENLQKKIVLRYEERRVGLQRYYESMQNQISVERVLRTPRAGQVTSQDIAITEDGRKYRVDLIQTVDDVYPPSVDITLAKIEQTEEQSNEMV